VREANVNIKNKIRNKKLTVGSWLQLPGSFTAEIMTKSGFDWLAIDMEHGLLGLEDVFRLIQVIDLAGCMPLVRLPENDPSTIRRVMDAGAAGIIVPMVNSQEDALKALNALKYTPLGKRSFGLGRAHQFGGKFAEYIASSNSESILVVQIEHIDAVNNLDEILAVSGIDAIFIGPYDLSGSIGKPGQFDDPQFLEILLEIKSKVQKTNVALGLHIVHPDQEIFMSKVAEGFSFIAYGMDTIFLKGGIENSLSKIGWRKDEKY
jgi:2-keto-3-deoxy-L-rhamnonate aldolase RhmA